MFIYFSVAEVLNQLNQVPNQRALLRNQRALANSNNNNNVSSPSISTNGSSSNSSALSLLNAVAAATNMHSLIQGIY